MDFKVIDVTPELATAWLTQNKVNRTLNPNRVAQYARDMALGEWQLNGECIAFDEDGMLKDGQHRLHGVVKANTTVKMGILTNIDRNTTLFDRGKNRSTADTLRLAGFDKNIANGLCVSIAKLYFAITKSDITRLSISDYEIRDFILEHEESLSHTRDIISHRKTKTSVISVKSAAIGLSVMTAIEQHYSIEKLSRWAEVVRTGFKEDSTEDSAIVFRNDLISKAINFNGDNARIRAVYQTEKAIYDFMNNTKRQKSYSNCIKPVYSNYTRKKG